MVELEQGFFNYYLPHHSFLYPLVRDYIGWKNSMVETLEKTLSEQPNNIMARVVELGTDLMRTDLPLTSENYQRKLTFLKELLEKQKNQSNQDDSLKIQALHVSALETWMKGQYVKATQIWEELLQIDPLDVLALKFAHDSYFYLGQSENICKSVERHVSQYEASDRVPMELYGYFLGMLAFGLEETHRYEEAETAALKAIEINQDDAWALHALAHINEMRGDIQKGIDFMKFEEGNWANCQALACHMWWHLCLYLLDQGKKAEVLKIYDEKISHFIESVAPLDLVDASSLLYRLYMEGMIEKDDYRWEKVRNVWKPIMNSHTLSFNDSHVAMVHNARENQEIAQATDSHLNSLELFANTFQNDQDKENNTCKFVHRQVGVPICKAIDAFSNSQYEQSVQLLKDIIIGGETHLIGGSNAQRDVFELLFLNSIFHSTNKENFSLAESILQKRMQRKPHSGQNLRLLESFNKVKTL